MLYLQYLDLILKPGLKALQLDTPGMAMLVAGTVAHESKGGLYIKQVEGPALGICQMEQTTHDSIWNSYLPNQANITNKLMNLCRFSRKPDAEQLVSNLLYSTVMCAILYKWRMDARKTAYPQTLEQAAQIWKEHFNTVNGKGTVEEFIDDYRKWCEPNTKPIKPAKAMAA